MKNVNINFNKLILSTELLSFFFNLLGFGLQFENGIFLSKILPASPAYESTELHVNDRILSVRSLF